MNPILIDYKIKEKIKKRNIIKDMHIYESSTGNKCFYIETQK